MSKALVIRGASFADNALDVIQFDVIHCTDISLSESTLTFSAIGATATLVPTVLPADCGDEIEWISSDENCCTVSQLGVVTVVGVGTCTITARCGTQSATCAVTVEVVLDNYGKYNNTIAFPANTTNDITSVASYRTSHSYYNAIMCGIAVDETETKLLVDLNMATGTGSGATLQPVDSRPNSYKQIGWCVPIALPPNCSKIRVGSLDSTFKSIALFFKKDVASTYCGGLVASRKQTTWSGSDTTTWPWSSGASAEFDVPDGYDSCVVVWELDANDSPFDKFYEATAQQLAAFTITAC